jgi:plastocyanin
MSSRSFRMAAAALALLALAAPSVTAKQIRINVTNFDFTPRYASMNQGDHAVWIWNNTAHTVTQGDTANVPVTPTPGSAKFNSGDASLTSATYTWKSNTTGLIEYYCIPHWPSMVGGLDIVSSGAQGLSDFRITEVQYNIAGNADLIEITNLGATGDLGMYRLKVSGAGLSTGNILRNGSATTLPVAAGAKFIIHLGASGINDANNLYFSGIPGLPDAAGSVALYVPNNVNTSLTLSSMLIDYVSWGSGGQENEATAVSANLWSSSNAVPLVASGSSIEFCGQSGQYGAARWYENPTPNFGGSDNCLTPVTPTTWGRIKVLYK